MAVNKEKEEEFLPARRNFTKSLLIAGSISTSAAYAMPGSPEQSGIKDRGWLNVRTDFLARGDGIADDTAPLQRAIEQGAKNLIPIIVPPGCYRTTRPLIIPSNTMIVGSAPGLGFGCRIEPNGCSALMIGGQQPSFHCSIENLMIWPKGKAPDTIISIDNSYSVTLRNIRIHETQKKIERAAVLLLGDVSAGGHGRCNNIIWDNLVVRNDDAQPSTAILATKGCGSHRFINPGVENFGTLFEWQGGQIDLVTPYTERAGRYGINCNVDADDVDAYLNTFGGRVYTADSGLGCAIRATTRNLSSFGTHWGGVSGRAAHVYELPRGPISFYQSRPGKYEAKSARFSGVDGWKDRINFDAISIRHSIKLSLQLPARGKKVMQLDVPGVVANEFWVKVQLLADSQGAAISGHVSENDVVLVTLQNPVDQAISINGTLVIECQEM